MMKRISAWINAANAHNNCFSEWDSDSLYEMYESCLSRKVGDTLETGGVLFTRTEHSVRISLTHYEAIPADYYSDLDEESFCCSEDC